MQNRPLSVYDKLGVPDLDDAAPDLQSNKRVRALALRAVNAESPATAERDLQAWLRRQRP